MSVSRRSFIVTAALAGVAAGTASPVAEVLALPRPQKYETPAFGGAMPTSADFAARLGDTFRIRYSSEGWANLWLDTRLAAVTDMGSTKEQLGAGGECFRIVLSSRGGAELPQGSYTVDNAKLGSMSLLLVPGGEPGSPERRYTAVFNRGTAANSR